MTLEELRGMVRREIAVTDWIEITQERIDTFADATEDHQWIHIDQERAQRESPYETTIAHGFLTLALLSKFLKDAIHIGGVRMGINYGLNRVRFPAAVPVGSRIRARFVLQSMRDVSDATEAIYSITVASKSGEALLRRGMAGSVLPMTRICSLQYKSGIRSPLAVRKL